MPPHVAVQLVVVPNAGHGLYMEQQRERWYQEGLLHLELSNRPATSGGEQATNPGFTAG